MFDWFKARFAEPTSHLAIAGVILLTGLQIDAMLGGAEAIPHLPVWYAACLILFLYPESVGWAKAAGVALPGPVSAVLEGISEPIRLDASESGVKTSPEPAQVQAAPIPVPLPAAPGATQENPNA
jgi:hypothetical protein